MTDKRQYGRVYSHNWEQWKHDKCLLECQIKTVLYTAMIKFRYTSAENNGNCSEFKAPARDSLNQLDVVGRNHALVSSPLHNAVHPAVVDHLIQSDAVVLEEAHLVIVLCIVVVHCHVHRTLQFVQQNVINNDNKKKKIYSAHIVMSHESEAQSSHWQ